MQWEWKTAWRYLPIDFHTTIGVLENVTQRLWISNNMTGSKVRITFSNLYSDEVLLLDKVVISKVDKENPNKLKTFTTVTRHGRQVIEVAPKKVCKSDEIYVPISQTEDIVISVYIKEKTNIKAVCETWNAKTWRSVFGKHGDYTLQEEFDTSTAQEVLEVLDYDEHKANVSVAITSVEVLTNQKVKSIALFGDSITHMSYYSDAFTKRLFEAYQGKVTVINAGIGGNRLLSDYSRIDEIPGGGTIFGREGVKRFEEDVYGDGKKEAVLILIGINDFTHPYALSHPDEVVTIENYIHGMETLIAIAKKHKSKVYLATLTPFKGENMEWFEAVDTLRRQANAWIREQKIADGFVDFDRAVCDEKDDSYMQSDAHLGDSLHPNEIGGKRMADAIHLEWFC